MLISLSYAAAAMQTSTRERIKTALLVAYYLMWLGALVLIGWLGFEAMRLGL